MKLVGNKIELVFHDVSISGWFHRNFMLETYNLQITFKKYIVLLKT